MSMYFTNIVLDGVKNGIGAFVRSKNQWIKNGRDYLFTNFKSADARVARSQIDYHDIAFMFVIDDPVTSKATISINEALKTENGWKVQREEELYGQRFLHIYNIEESSTNEVINVGYITSKDSGTHDPGKDPKYEYAKLRKIRNMVYKAAAHLASYQCYEMSISKDKFGYNIGLDNTTATIHIWTMGKLMDYNTEVKKMRDANKHLLLRCLPYLPNKDKYADMYIFATCQSNDMRDDYTLQKIQYILEELIYTLQDSNPDDAISYIPCEFQGRVILSEEVIRNDHSSENRSK